MPTTCLAPCRAVPAMVIHGGGEIGSSGAGARHKQPIRWRGTYLHHVLHVHRRRQLYTASVRHRTLFVLTVAIPHCRPQKPQDKIIGHPLLARKTGIRVDSTIGKIHGPPMHHGAEATLSHSGKTQTPYHTGTTHAHESVPGHRLVHTHHGGRLGGDASRFLLFPAERQLYSGQDRCFQLTQAPLPWRRSLWQDRRHIYVSPF